MAESTHTLQELRRLIALELQMPFFKKYGTSQTVDASSTTTLIIDANLTQPNDFWNGSFFYHITSQEVRQISDFDNNAHSLIPEYALSAITTDDEYEIHSIWNATDIHKAINRAIEQAAKSFPITTTDESLILEEDKLAYIISGLSVKPWRVANVWVERNSQALRGTATAGAVGYLTDTGLIGQVGDVDTNWKISVYDGTGSGQIRSVSTANNTTGQITPSSNWTTAPDTTSKYCLWNPTEQIYDWYSVSDVHFDAKEYPDTLYFQSRLSSVYGMRIRLEYIATETGLTAEADTTIVNSEYIIAKAVSILHGQMIGDSRYNRELHYGEHVRYKEQADELLSRYRVDIPDITRWTDNGNTTYDSNDPLGWSNY